MYPKMIDDNTHGLLAKLGNIWETKRPSLRRLLRPPAARSKVLAFEKSLAQRLPQPLKSFYYWHDGLRDEHAPMEEFFGWCSLSSMKKHKQSLDKMEEKGFFEDWQPGSWWNPGWLPFLQFNNEDYVCVDLNGALLDLPGAVFIRRNSDDRRTILAPSFNAWLQAHVAMTEAGPDAPAADDAWVEHFLSKKAMDIRSQITPDFPKYVSAIRANEAE